MARHACLFTCLPVYLPACLPACATVVPGRRAALGRAALLYGYLPPATAADAAERALAQAVSAIQAVLDAVPGGAGSKDAFAGMYRA